MSSPDASDSGFREAVARLLQHAGAFELKQLSGGANNQVYRVEMANHAPLVLKRYFHSPADTRDRFHSEKSFYDLITATGQPAPIAKPLTWDREQRLGLFTWIEGRRLELAEVTREKVDQALAFYFMLNDGRRTPEAEAAPNASEACFDVAQHFATVERRLARLASIDAASPLGRDALDFVSARLKPAFENHRRRQAQTAATAPLDKNKRCLSPSDFGFHNALLQANGRLAFFDFEYAGWDDPAKFLCDFLCQPALPVPRSLWPHCFESLCRDISGGTRRDRIALLLPLYQMKWCCILLNEFLPQEQSRRAFSRKLSPEELEARKREQLAKAAALLDSLVTPDVSQALGLDDPAPAVP